MKKKLFMIISIAIGMQLSCFSQVTKESVENKAKELQNKIMTEVRTQDLKTSLKDVNPKHQFLIGKGKSIKYGKNSVGSTQDLSEVIKAITKRNGFTIDTLNYEVTVNNIKEDTKKTERGGRSNRFTTTDTIAYYVTTIMDNCKTELTYNYKEKESKEYKAEHYSANYTVEMVWKIALDNEGGTGRVTKISKDKNHKLVSVKVKQADNNSIIIENKKAEAKKLIKEWYEKKAETEVRNKMTGHKVLDVNIPESYDVDVKPTAKGASVSVDGPAITVSVDPKEFMTQPEEYYQNLNADFLVTPQFTVTYDKEGKGSLATKLDAKENKMPETKHEIIDRLNTGVDAFNGFTGKLSTFAGDKKNNELRTELEELFVSKKSPIETSVKKNDKVRIKRGKKAPQAGNYFRNLKAESMGFNPVQNEIEYRGDEPDVRDRALVIPFVQDYQGKRYCDHTKKEMYLKWNEEQKKYLIEKIVVVEDGTTLCDE